ncbi:MAG: NUDIX domain-containing protein [Acetobacteraceae bacterium]|nr:NUDIX hydrolase [Pseudomonadota bacterium]
MEPTDENALKPIASVDLVVLALSEHGLQVLLIRRQADPFRGAWALPGGWIHTDEDPDLDAAAARVSREKTGVETPYLEQLATFGSAGRDPRGWSVSVGYVALLPADEVAGRAAESTDTAWHAVTGDGVAVPLAFDHASILRAGLIRLRAKVEYTSLPVHLLPAGFTLGELQAVYERILGRRLDKSAFRKRIAEVDFVEPVPSAMRRGSNRPAQIYRVKPGLGTAFFDRTI